MSANASFVLHPLHRKYAHNASHRRPPSYAFIYWIGLVLLSPFVAAGLFVLALTGQQIWDWGRFQWEAVVTEAIVLDRSEDSDSDGTSYRVEYRYRDARGRLHRHSDAVSPELYARALPETQIPVRYLRSEPTRSRAGEQAGFPVMVVFLIFFSTVWNLPMGFVLTKVVQALLKERRWSVEGVVVPAEILSAAVTTNSDGDHFLEVRYCLVSPAGDKLYGDERMTVTDERKQLVPTAGTPAVAAYLDPHTYRLL